LAYFEVCHELELIINLIKRGGLDYMRYSISNTAEFGDYYTGPKIVDDETKKRMQAALKHIQDGGFAKAFRDDYEKGFPWFKQQREENKG
ncbi:ketol-acid reductoisomerase, partial [Halomonas sp. SIMBA_159]